ncbi:MAG: dephospho-CoA kinase [Elusimicrobia bacterium CG08_land_8_20_14_0_20_51_18]|nr:MAG: dephospho-CoA kinase [Elusimicrobia bacterium CG08_land_8_20_14_0_20_51_18]
MNLGKYAKDFEKAGRGKLLVGLTGQVGCGKSSALAFFREEGAFTVSTDALANKLLTNVKCYSKILEEFKNAVKKDGSLDRYKVSETVFRNKTKRERLESLLHPLIIKETIPLIKKSQEKIIVIEVPLLFESGFHKCLDLSVCVYLDRKRQLERLSRRGWSAKNAELRIKAQFSGEKKAELSDLIMDNGGGRNSLKKQVKGLYGAFERISGN